MADLVKLIFAKPIHLALQVRKCLGDSSDFFDKECAELERKLVRLLKVLRRAAKASSNLYERPARVIIDDTNQVLEKAHVFVLKCQSFGCLKRVFAIIPASSFEMMSEQLENSIGDVSWLLRISVPAKVDSDFIGVGKPPFAKERPILYLIWDLTATVYSGSLDGRSDAAKSLESLGKDNDQYRKQIMDEGGAGPLLKLVKDGNPEGQASAARAIGTLGRDPEDVEHLIHGGVCSVFAKVLKEGPMKVKAAVAWALSELVGNYPKCQDLFAQHNTINLLVSCLAFETVDQEHSNYAIKSSNVSEGREPEDASSMKAMAARALWHLAIDNAAICHSITESKAMLCFAVLLERGTKDEQYSSAMALMEITALVEKDTDPGRSVFKPKSPTRQAVVDQLLSIIEKGEPDWNLLIPCVKSIGNLARTCKATETRMISPLVRLMEYAGGDFSLMGLLEYTRLETIKEVLIVLSKAVCHENYTCVDHSKAISSTGVVEHLVQMAESGKEIVQIPALVLLSYISLHIPENEELAKHFVLYVIEYAERQVMAQSHTLMKLLPEARSELELYQGTAGEVTFQRLARQASLLSFSQF